MATNWGGLFGKTVEVTNNDGVNGSFHIDKNSTSQDAKKGGGTVYNQPNGKETRVSPPKEGYPTGVLRERNAGARDYSDVSGNTYKGTEDPKNYNYKTHLHVKNIK